MITPELVETSLEARSPELAYLHRVLELLEHPEAPVETTSLPRSPEDTLTSVLMQAWQEVMMPLPVPLNPLHQTLRGTLPESFQAALAERESRGPSLAEGLETLLGPVERLVTSRGELLGPYSPFPHLLRGLLQRYRLDGSLHAHQSERMRLLVSMLPMWLEGRGRPSVARTMVGLLVERRPEEVLEISTQTLQVPPVVKLEQNPAAPDEGALETADDDDEATLSLFDAPDQGARAPEILCCHRLDWYGQRYDAQPLPAEPLRVHEGLVVMPEALAAHFSLAREDVRTTLDGEDPHLLPVLRLLPVWAQVRIRAGLSGASDLTTSWSHA